MDTTTFALYSEQRRVQAEAAAAISRIKTAKTIAEIVRFSNVQVRSTFRCFKHMMPELRSLQHASERRAEEIVSAQLTALAKHPTGDEFMVAAGRLRAGDWRMLSGHFPTLARRMQLESAKLARRFPQEEQEPA